MTNFDDDFGGLDDLDLDLDLGLDDDEEGQKKPEAAPTNPDAVPLTDEKSQLEKNIEAEVDEMSEALRGFKQRAADEQKRMDWATQTDFWVNVVFQTLDQADAFREAIGQPREKYVDGVAVARHLGIEIPEADVRFTDTSRQDLRLIALIAEDQKRERGEYDPLEDGDDDGDDFGDDGDDFDLE